MFRLARFHCLVVVALTLAVVGTAVGARASAQTKSQPNRPVLDVPPAYDPLIQAKELLPKLNKAKDAVLAARQASNQGLEEAERQLAATARQYANVLKEAHAAAKWAKNQLLSMAGNITPKTFDDANDLIDNYNYYQGFLAQYPANAVYGGPVALPPSIARVRASELRANIMVASGPVQMQPGGAFPQTSKKGTAPGQALPSFSGESAGSTGPKTGIAPTQKLPGDSSSNLGGVMPGDDLGGSTYTGQENLGGFGQLSFEFQKGGKAVMRDAKDTVTGTWAQNGDRVTLRFFNGGVVYQGTLKGQQLSGNASNGKASWKWSTTLK